MPDDAQAHDAALPDLSHLPAMMTPQQLANELQVTVDILFLWRKAGEGPPWTQPTSRVVRYLREDVAMWLAKGRVVR